jgi:hypothetical protein
MMSLLAEFDWNSVLEPEKLAMILIFGGSFIVAIVGTIAGCWLSARRHTEQIKLKQEMLDRGMSADEIARIIDAGNKK